MERKFEQEQIKQMQQESADRIQQQAVQMLQTRAEQSKGKEKPSNAMPRKEHVVRIDHLSLMSEERVSEYAF